jgi:hypothetical protein
MRRHTTRKKNRKAISVFLSRIHCLVFRYYSGDCDCDYSFGIDCQDCILCGGSKDPRTGKTLPNRTVRMMNRRINVRERKRYWSELLFDRDGWED